MICISEWVEYCFSYVLDKVWCKNTYSINCLLPLKLAFVFWLQLDSQKICTVLINKIVTEYEIQGKKLFHFRISKPPSRCRKKVLHFFPPTHLQVGNFFSERNHFLSLDPILALNTTTELHRWLFLLITNFQKLHAPNFFDYEKMK